MTARAVELTGHGPAEDDPGTVTRMVGVPNTWAEGVTRTTTGVPLPPLY